MHVEPYRSKGETMITFRPFFSYTETYELDMEVTRFINNQILDMLTVAVETAQDFDDESRIIDLIPRGCFRDKEFSVQQKLEEIRTILSDDILREKGLKPGPVNQYIIMNIISNHIELWGDDEMNKPIIPRNLKEKILNCKSYYIDEERNIVYDFISYYEGFMEILYEDWDFVLDFVDYFFEDIIQNGTYIYYQDEDLSEFLPLLSDDMYDIYLKKRAIAKKQAIESEDGVDGERKVSDHSRDAIQKRTDLFHDILIVCAAMQRSKIYENVSEDDRNTYVRDMLQMKGYIVSDQTRCGKSERGKRAGQLDLEIRLRPDISWTVYEALNISGSSSSNIKYWDRHLSKLLDNYNAIGYPFTFLVSYLNCKKVNFQSIWDDYFKHVTDFSPESYRLLAAIKHNEGPSYLRAAELIYSCGELKTRVYHIMVLVGG